MKSSDLQSDRTARPFFRSGSWRRWVRWLFVGCVTLFSLVVVTILVALFASRPPADQMFRGKLESEWIAEVKYYDEAQAEEWKEYGEEGVEVLIRGLKRAQRPMERLHRRWYGPTRRFLVGRVGMPPTWFGIVPKPKKDETWDVRGAIISLLYGLDDVAYFAAPLMIPSLDDEQHEIQQSATSYFSGKEQEDAPFLHLTPRQKLDVFERLQDFVAQTNRSGLRNNAAVAMRFFPEQKEEIVPFLLDMLKDKEMYARCSAAATLFVIAPESGDTKEVATVLLEILNDPDDQVATRAPRLLSQVTVDQERVVAELLKNMKSRDTIVSTGAAMALGNFPDYSESIVPALWEAYQDSEQRVRRWGIEPSLKKLDPERAAAAGIR